MNWLRGGGDLAPPGSKREWLKLAATKVAEQANGGYAPPGSKREQLKLAAVHASTLVAQHAQSTHEKLVNGALSTHDLITEKLHEQKHGMNRSSSSSAGAAHSLHIEVLAAADLREEKAVQQFATCDSYASAAVGRVGETWAVKCKGAHTTTQVVPRKRHPRWGKEITLAVWSFPQASELTVRVMDSKTMGADCPLGEVRVDLSQLSAGARCFRLQGGGFASLSLRWSLRSSSCGDGGDEPLPQGDQAFEEALAFWAIHRDAESALLAVELASMLKIDNGALANELVLQAPLSLVLRAEDEALAILLRDLTAVLGDLRAPALARLAVALDQQLGQRNEPSSFPIPINGLVRTEHRVRNSPGERLLRDILCSASGQELVELKRLIDTGGTRFNLFHVVHTTIVDEDLRLSVLAHFIREAVQIPSADRPMHVISDIDMTVWVGTFGAGGPKFPQGPIPGAMSLFRALGGRITFLSARPPVWASQTRRDLLDDIGIAEANLLTGDLRVVLESVIWRKEGHRAMGEKKTEAFSNWAVLHPEAQFVFVGDSGEGDVDFALGFASSDDFNARVGLIHDVVDDEGLVPKTSAERRMDLEQQGVVVFDTYAGAALALFEREILTAEGLRCAAQACHDEFEEIASGEFVSVAVYRVRCEELLNDLQRVDAALVRSGCQAVDVRLVNLAVNSGDNAVSRRGSSFCEDEVQRRRLEALAAARTSAAVAAQGSSFGEDEVSSPFRRF